MEKKKKKKDSKKKNLIPVKELGGELAQNWPAYLSSADRLIFVIDPNNLNNLPEITVHFINCLETLANSKTVKDS